MMSNKNFAHSRSVLQLDSARTGLGRGSVCNVSQTMVIGRSRPVRHMGSIPYRVPAVESASLI